MLKNLISTVEIKHPATLAEELTPLILEDILSVLREEYKEAGPRGKELIHKLANKYKERYK